MRIRWHPVRVPDSDYKRLKQLQAFIKHEAETGDLFLPLDVLKEQTVVSTSDFTQHYDDEPRWNKNINIEGDWRAAPWSKAYGHRPSKAMPGMGSIIGLAVAALAWVMTKHPEEVMRLQDEADELRNKLAELEGRTQRRARSRH